MEHPNVGDVVTCAETGKRFAVARDGCSFNYATTVAGEIVSDEGVDIRERRELLDRASPFFGYISGDGKRLTGWKGNTLGHVIAETNFRGGGFRRIARIHAYRIRDVHGGLWYGRNGGPGLVIKLRAAKG